MHNAVFSHTIDDLMNTKSNLTQSALLTRAMILVVAISLLASSACTQTETQTTTGPTNIVLITVDTLRADRLAPYGYAKNATPSLARLAAEGILFEQATTDTSWTLPSLTSVMTGQYPTRHGVRSWNHRLAESEQTLAEVLRSKNYRTAAILGSYALDRYFGLAQGFDHYDDTMTRSMFILDPGKKKPKPANARPARDTHAARTAWQMRRERTNAYRSDSDVADTAIAWVEENEETPYFLWVHFFGPHEKDKRTGLSKREKGAFFKELIARYDPDVATMDQEVGRLIDAIRKAPHFDRTAIVFHSDHGQSLHEHGVFGHGLDLFESTVHIPLIVRLPGAERAGERVRDVVRNLDIFTTVLDLAGVTPENVESRNLLDERDRSTDYAYMESFLTLGFSVREAEVEGRKRKLSTVLKGIRTNDAKLVADSPVLFEDNRASESLPNEFVSDHTKVKLYDLESDPNEKVNVAKSQQAARAKLMQLLAAHKAESEAGPQQVLDDAAIERLRSLGYDPKKLEKQ